MKLGVPAVAHPALESPAPPSGGGGPASGVPPSFAAMGMQEPAWHADPASQASSWSWPPESQWAARPSDRQKSCAAGTSPGPDTH